jgi:2-iminobutanoate/2-iminopropanoate deaminase
MEVISTTKAPQALGPYSQAIVAGNTVYCSGQIAINPATGELVLENIEAEAEQVMQNIGAVLEAAGCTYANVVKRYKQSKKHFMQIIVSENCHLH